MSLLSADVIQYNVAINRYRSVIMYVNRHNNKTVAMQTCTAHEATLNTNPRHEATL